MFYRLLSDVFQGIAAEGHTVSSVQNLKSMALRLLVEWQSTAKLERLGGAQLHVMVEVIGGILRHGAATDSWCLRRVPCFVFALTQARLALSGCGRRIRLHAVLSLWCVPAKSVRNAQGRGVLEVTEGQRYEPAAPGGSHRAPRVH